MNEYPPGKLVEFVAKKTLNNNNLEPLSLRGCVVTLYLYQFFYIK